MNKRAAQLTYCLLSFFMSAATAMQPLNDADLRAAQVASNSLLVNIGAKPAFVAKPSSLPFCNQAYGSKQVAARESACIDPATGAVPLIEYDNINKLAAQLPVGERIPVWNWEAKQIMYLPFDLFHDDLIVHIGNDGEVFMLGDVTLHKDGVATRIGPISSRIGKGERIDGRAQVTLFSDAELDFSLYVGAMHIARNEQVAPTTSSLGGVIFGNILANASNEITMHHD